MAYALTASDGSMSSVEFSSPVTPEEFASRSVVVKNLSPATKEEDVTIHFQRRRNGGGEVDCVRLSKEGTAVVTFEKSEVAVSVLERQHEIGGSHVTVEWYRHSIPDQVFGRVSGRLDPKNFGENNSTMKIILQTIQDETDVDWKEIFDGFVVSGTFEQIKSVNDILKTKLKEKLLSSVFHSQAIAHPEKHSKPSTEPQKRPKFLSEKLQVKTNQEYRKVKSTTYLKKTADVTTISPISDTQVIGDSVPSSVHSTDPSKRLLSVSEKPHEKQNQSYRKVKGFYAYQKENEVKANTPISENEPMVISDALPISKSKISDVGTTNTSVETQNHEETKQYCDAKIIKNSVEQDKIKRNSPNSKLLDEILTESKSNAHDVNSYKACQKENETKANIPISENEPMAIRDKLAFSNSKVTDVSTTNTSVETQNHEETKQFYDAKIIKNSVEQDKRKRNNPNSKLPHEIRRENKSNFHDVNSHKACQKENEIKANIPISEDEPMVNRDKLPFSKFKVSDAGTNSTNVETQNHEQTKRCCDAKILKNSVEQDKLPHEIRRESESNARDVQSKPKSLDATKTKGKSHSILPACSYEQVEKAKTVGCNTNSAVFVNGKQERSIEGGSYHKFVTVTGLKVLLLKGDITSQHVDVLLNPVNPTPSCEKGLSKLILEKGGQAVKDEYLTMIQNQTPLKDGYTFFTAGGNLPCRSVLHAVLPSWNTEKQDGKKCKLEIHRCLKEGLMLSSGLRHRSIALPPLGQDWNDIPLEVSVEVIVRVIASFGRNIGPIHSGVNEFCIVCEDDTTADAFLKDISSFSFRAGQPFFVSESSKSNQDAEQTSAHSASKRMIRNNNEGEVGDSFMPKESSVEQIHKAPETPVIDAIHADVSTVATQVSASQSLETTVENEKIPASYSTTEISSSSQFDRTPHQNQVDQDSNNERSKDTTPTTEEQVCVKAISPVSISSVEHQDITEIRAFEMLQVSSAVQLVEEEMKSMVVQDESHLAECQSLDLFLGVRLNVNQEKKITGRGRYKSSKETMIKIAQEMEYDTKQPQLKDFLPQKEQNEDSRETDIPCYQGVPTDVINHTPLSTIPSTLNSGSFFKKFVAVTGLTVLLLKGDITSQHVDVLLNPVNPTPSCEKGLSKLILEKGGQAVKDEYLTMIQNQTPLKDGYTFFTAGGNLPCRSVLHAVLPSWNTEKQDGKKCKLEIHRCLKEGLMLSSGLRHKSIALPPLGQDWNDIPLEVSVEVIVRVIASFGRNIGPIHSGINEFCIVCEDDKTIDAFLKDISSFSFREGHPFFVSESSKSKQDAEQTGAHSASKSMIRNNEGEVGDSSMPKESSVEQIHKAPETPVIAAIHADVSTVATQVSASQSLETTVENEKIPASYSTTEISSSSQFDRTPHQNQVDQDSNNGRNKDTNRSSEKQVCEKTISHVSISSLEHLDITEIRAFEMLQVSSAVQLVEEEVKSMVVQDKSDLAECQSSDLVLGDRLNLNQEKKIAGPGRYKSSKETMVKIAKGMEHVIKQSQLKDLLPQKEQNEDSRETDIHCYQGGPTEVINHTSLSTIPSALNSGSYFNKSGALSITSPTVDGLLKADITTSLQSLQLWSKERLEDAKDIQDGSIRNTSFLTIQEDDSREKSGIEVTHMHMPFEKTVIKEKERGNSVNKHWLVETKTNGDKVVDVDHPGRKPNVSEREISILCALCKDTVDHPELTHPDVCMKHKFCDDCIIKAFAISSKCPACMDTAGMITTDKETDKETASHNQHIHSSSPSSRCHRNQDNKSPWKFSSELTQGNQPPGEMMWKRYEDSLPGFQDHGTIAVTFNFYDGIQGSEHPNPGERYKGTSYVAYIPDTPEGKQVLKLLRKCFDARLVFTVLISAVDGVGYITLNDIELKTTLERGSRNGYPDEGYLSRLRNQLAAKGIR